MKTLSRLLLLVLLLAYLSGCAGTQYSTMGTGSGQQNYRSGCAMMDQQECRNWFYGSGGP